MFMPRLGTLQLNRDPSCVACYEVDAGSVVLNSGNASLLRNSSSTYTQLTRDVAQATANLQPELIAVGIGGLLCLHFRNNRYLKSSVWGAGQVQPSTHYSVYRPVAFENYAILVDGIDATNRNAIYNVAGTPSIYAGTELQASSRPLVVNENIVQCSVFNSASSSQFFLNNYTTPVVSGACGIAGISGVMFGVDPTAYANSANAYLACHYIYSGVHSATKREFIMRCLGNKYGITITG